MKLLTKPVWHEGMYLGPHLFQLQARYFEDSLDFAIAALWRDPYGFSGLHFDPDALRTGILSLTHASGLFEDGLSFDLPASDVAPPRRNFGSEFGAVADHLTMYLALPEYVRDGQNVSLDDTSSNVRYHGVKQKLLDLNTGMDEREIRMGQKNLVLLTEKEVSDEARTSKVVSLPVVRIIRDGAGKFEADSSFVAPSLSLNASKTLMDMLGRLIGILEEKSNVFTQRQRQRSGVFIAGMSDSDLTQYWFLHALNSSIGPIRHLMLARHVHPEALFREMLRLAGALCTFGLAVHPRALPAYNHRDLGGCFAALDQHIRDHAEIVMPSRAINIPLKQVDSDLYEGDLKDERCLGPSRWLLEVYSPIGVADLIVLVPRLAKLCSARFAPELRMRSVGGLTLNHLSSPPPQVAAKVESQYFSIARTGRCWDHIVETRRLGILLPAEIPSPQLSIIVLLDE